LTSFNIAAVNVEVDCYRNCLVDLKQRVQLLRYNDPALGPRKLPNFDNLSADKTTIEASDTFAVDTRKHAVTLQCGTGLSVAVGSQLVYIVNS